MGREAEGSWDLVFFAQDITDVCTIKRVQGFLDHGFSPIVFGFLRGRYNRDYKPSWPHVLLGNTKDGKYWQRFQAVLTSIPVVIASRRHLKQVPIFYARNIDQLILALLARFFFNRKATVAYEILDIQPIFAQHGFIPALLRMIERLCLRHIRLLVVSSPGFYRNYYATRQRYCGEWFVLENKLHRSIFDYAPTARKMRGPVNRGGYRWVVGYFGLIRGQATFDLMARLAVRLHDKVLFKFRGVLTTVDKEHFFATLSRNNNMIYEGEYENPRDMEALYGNVDFAWALDLEHIQHNSRWLLPCRFYEAGLFGVPCLVVHGFEIGTLIERLGVGWAFEEPFESALARFFETVTLSEYEEKRQRLLALPVGTLVAKQDVATLCRILVSQAKKTALGKQRFEGYEGWMAGPSLAPTEEVVNGHHTAEMDEPPRRIGAVGALTKTVGED